MSVRDSLSVVRTVRPRALLVALGLTLAFGVLCVVEARTAVAARWPAQAADIDDDSTTRRIQLVAGGLAVLGVALAGVTIWFWRSTRPDPEPLAPLELMGTRKWRRADPIERRHLLDEVRAHLNDDAAVAARLTVEPGTTAPPSLAISTLVAKASDPPSQDVPAAPESAAADEASAGVTSEAQADDSSDAGRQSPPRPVHGDPLVHALDTESSGP